MKKTLIAIAVVALLSACGPAAPGAAPGKAPIGVKFSPGFNDPPTFAAFLLSRGAIHPGGTVAEPPLSSVVCKVHSNNSSLQTCKYFYADGSVPDGVPMLFLISSNGKDWYAR